MNTKFKKGDLVKIWAPNPLRTDKNIPKRLPGSFHEADEWLIDQNHGKLGVIVKINLHNTDNLIYTVLINGRTGSYGQHCLKEV